VLTRYVRLEDQFFASAVGLDGNDPGALPIDEDDHGRWCLLRHGHEGCEEWRVVHDEDVVERHADRQYLPKAQAMAREHRDAMSVRESGLGVSGVTIVATCRKTVGRVGGLSPQAVGAGRQ
jgi:hypothetical protein